MEAGQIAMVTDGAGGVKETLVARGRKKASKGLDMTIDDM
jgi:hypothetical protein